MTERLTREERNRILLLFRGSAQFPSVAHPDSYILSLLERYEDTINDLEQQITELEKQRAALAKSLRSMVVSALAVGQNNERIDEAWSLLALMPTQPAERLTDEELERLR